MDNRVTTYKANKLYSIPLVIVPVLLLVPLLESGTPIDSGKLFGFMILSLLALFLVLLPIPARLKINNDTVKSFFLGFCLMELKASSIQLVQYGNLFHGGLGIGKGLKIRAIVNGKSKGYTIGEKFYGKEAIAHAKRVLEMGGKK